MSTSGPNDDLDPNDRAGSEPGAITWEPIDLLLNQGTLEEVAAMRDEVASDPMLALDLAVGEPTNASDPSSYCRSLPIHRGISVGGIRRCTTTEGDEKFV